MVTTMQVNLKRTYCNLTSCIRNTVICLTNYMERKYNSNESASYRILLEEIAIQSTPGYSFQTHIQTRCILNTRFSVIDSVELGNQFFPSPCNCHMVNDFFVNECLLKGGKNHFSQWKDLFAFIWNRRGWQWKNRSTHGCWYTLYRCLVVWSNDETMLQHCLKLKELLNRSSLSDVAFDIPYGISTSSV